MTTIAVVPMPGGAGFRAIAGDAEGVGATPGQALDALAERAGRPPGPAVVLIGSLDADEFFSADQQARLTELTERRRVARAAGRSLTAAEQTELEAIVADELKATTARSAAMLAAVRP